MGDYQFHSYHVVIGNPRHIHTVHVPTEADRAEIYQTFNELPFLLGQDKWLLAGGISLPALTKQILRRHEDIDTAIDVRDFKEVAERIIEQRYGIFTRMLMNHVSPTRKMDVYRTLTPEEAVQKGVKNVRFVRVDQRGKIVLHAHLLDYMDVYLYETRETTIIYREGEVEFPGEWNQHTQYQTTQGQMFSIRDMRIIEALKSKEPRSKHREEKDTFDIKGLKAWQQSQRR